MSLLVTGGTGYIGSHTVGELIGAGHEVIIVDDLSNSKQEVIDRLEQITGTRPVLYHGDVADRALLEQIFSNHTITGVLHFAAKKSVGESCASPWLYYTVNCGALQTLTEVMEIHECRSLVFSSSCTVYDPGASQAPFDEQAPTGNCFSPYGTTKLMNELLIRDLAVHKQFRVANLRYFNPIGAHPSGLIGEDPSQPPTNVLPVMFDVIRKKRPHLTIYGDDYATSDGTCLRDYIHVVDLAAAHTAALNRLMGMPLGTIESFNLGTGTPTSVKELVAIVEKVTTQQISSQIGARRDGDIPVAYANATKAQNHLGRSTILTVEDAVRDSRRFIKNIS